MLIRGGECHRPEFHIDWNGVMDEIHYISGLSEQYNCSLGNEFNPKRTSRNEKMV